MQRRAVPDARVLPARQGPDPACLAAGRGEATPRARGDRRRSLAGETQDDPPGTTVHARADQAGGPVRARSGGAVALEGAPDMARGAAGRLYGGPGSAAHDATS